jgi:hypothetical protein
MATYANVLSGPQVDGTVYAVNCPLTSGEADVGNSIPPSQGAPVSVKYGEAVLAVITFTAVGPFGSATSYICLQTSLDGQNWLDVGGCVWNGVSGSATFFVSAGVAGALSAQQTRQPGTAPSGNFANAMVLGGVLRFVGATKTTPSSSSSASSGTSPGVVVSIRWKLLGLR